MHNEELGPARGLLLAVMALVGPHETEVRNWLPRVGASSPIDAMREDVLDALDQTLVNASPSTSAGSKPMEA